MVQHARELDGEEASPFAGDFVSQRELGDFRLLVAGDVRDLDSGLGALDIDAAFVKRQFLRVDRNGAGLLQQLERDLDGSIVGEFLGVEVVEVQLVTGRFDAVLFATSQSAF